jgi:predicted component of type VI protein secretion system
MADFTFVERKPMEGREHVLEADITVGREGCDVALPDPEVSRRHAALRRTPEGAAVEDLGSTNGTFVNGERITGLRPLADGDVVSFGNTEWELRAAAAAAGAGVGSPQVTAARAVPAEPPPAPPAQDQPAAPQQSPPAAPAAPATPSAAADVSRPVDPGLPGSGRRGDVPLPPEVTPSAIHRTLPESAKSAPPAFAPVGTRQQKGSAATRAGYTAFCMAVFVAALIGVIVYFILN